MLIGFIGLKGSGKDSIVSEYNKKHGFQIETCKFAFGLREIIANYFNISYDQVEEQKEAFKFENGKTPRDLMKEVGCLFREYKSSVWVERLFAQKELKYLYFDMTHIAFTDVRFENELEKIKSKGGIIIDINRPDLYKREKQFVNLFGVNWLSRSIIYLFGDRSITPQSEWNYFKLKEKADYQINNSTLDSAVKQLEFILDESMK